jgi:hypothetical protein
MRSRTAQLLALIATATIVTLAGCKPDPAPAPLASQGVESGGETASASEDAPGAAPTGWASGGTSGVAADLDMGALQERRDPERLLRFYTNAIRVGDWTNAAKAWSLDALMTPEKLRAEFDGDAGPKLALGRGDWTNAAGSLFYETPVTVDFPDGRESRRGSIVMQRANDVPGASAQQLVWRIERSSIVPQ